MSELRERVSEIFANSKHRSVSAFARSVDAKVPTISDTIKGNSEPRFTLLASILRANPDVSAEWLMRGEGEMYRSQRQQRTAGDVSITNSGDGNAAVNGDIIVEQEPNGGQLLKDLKEKLDEMDAQIRDLCELIKDKDGQTKKLLSLLEQKMSSKVTE